MCQLSYILRVVVVLLLRTGRTCLNGLERVTHHSDEHVSEDDDDSDVIQRKQEQSDTLDHRRGVAAEREVGRIIAVVPFVWVLDLDVVDRHQTKHRPEQAE